MYVAAKLLFLLVLEPRWDAARASSNRAAGYALAFDPVVALGALGRYVSAAVAPLYPLGHSPGWYRAAGGCTVVLTIATVAATWLAKPPRPWVGVTACGLVLLVLGLVQVLFLPPLFGVGHRLFLCASYDVRPVPDVRAVPSRPGLVVVEQPAAPLGDDLRGWLTVVRQCPE
jgi:hypothetical protein